MTATVYLVVSSASAPAPDEAKARWQAGLLMRLPIAEMTLTDVAEDEDAADDDVDVSDAG